MFKFSEIREAVALSIAISIRKWNCSNLRFYHVMIIKLPPLCGITYIPVVGIRIIVDEA